MTERTPPDTGPATGSEVEAEPPVGKLRRSKQDKVIAGVCGGLGAYFGVDPLWFRLGFVALTLGGGSGILVYIVAVLIVPEQQPDETLHRGPKTIGEHGPVIAGVLLVALGLMLLVDNVFPWFDRVVWPLVAIAAGAALIYTGSSRARD